MKRLFSICWFYLWLNKHLIKMTFWAIARVWGYGWKKKQIPFVLAFGVSTKYQHKWWAKQIIKLNKRRAKLDRRVHYDILRQRPRR